MYFLRARPVAAMVAILWMPVALADGVSVRYDSAHSPFPTNRLTVLDHSNATFRRVNLPRPDCAIKVSDCADIDVINTLDGFSTQPRITIPFTGDIDVNSVSSDTVYLYNLGDTLTLRGFGQKVGINQVLWDPASQTLVFEPDELLAERSRYVLVVTNGVRDANGKKLKINDAPQGGPGQGNDKDKGKMGAPIQQGDLEYQRELRDATNAVRSRSKGLNVVAASLFTTQTSTGELINVMRQIKSKKPAPASFDLGTSAAGKVRSVFPLADIQAIQFNRQTGAQAFTPSFLPTPALDVVKGAVGSVAYGKFSSPNYQTAARFIPPTSSLTGKPIPQGSNELVFQLFLPNGTAPKGGWPVAIFGHGFTDSMYGAPWTVASVFASRGLATLAINVVGHAGGSQGTLNVIRNTAPPVTLPAGGRGFDQNGDGSIEATEGVNAAAPFDIIGSRDGLRQTVIDLMQLVRQIEVGMDVNGDGMADLDPRRIYYTGQSFGGIYGTMLLGVEPNIQAGVPNVPGGSITEVARLGGFRLLTAGALASRQPQLLNLPPPPGVPFPQNLVFNENMPLRDLPPVINDVPGALAIAEVLDRTEWVQQSGNPVSYAPLIRKQPVFGQRAKPVIVQFAKGDSTVPNPTSTAIVRAGGLQDRTTYFRNDLAYAANNAVSKNPHTFLTNIGAPAAQAYAIGAQIQIAEFFASNGAVVIDPDGPGPFFEVPIAPPLPEGLNFIP
ncbi:Ig-like domain-containing protein [Hydrogenophaga sp.]|uniref:Ig-like domain-containing protein n=1 Tax=Hydrogenophaga sp. TaxID=1904254 RepID=UPI00271EB70A|nr:Ig-like domain-containing protein [Hydrogenophaga sp.]MDO8906510.1 Ig-like domain-containing protein [Hydrogenophaga sp.]